MAAGGWGGVGGPDFKQKKKKKISKSGDSRRERRNAEAAEIKELEARIAAEAPPAGSGSILGSNPEGGEDGPKLTRQPFADLPLSQRTLKGLKEARFTKMTEIQRSAIPHALAGRDVLGEARTGSGKTLAFLVPLVELLFRRRWTKYDGLGAIVLSPTRELAVQIFQVVTNMGTHHDLSAGCVVGGRQLSDEQRAILSMNVLVASPGRLLQHLDETVGFDASNLQMLVLDEADRILDLGFQETVHNILQHLPRERQTLLFSATLHSSVHRLGKAALRSPELLSMHRDAANRCPEKLKQVYMVVPLEKKVDTLFSFLRSQSQKKMIVFVSACKQARFFYEAFKRLKPGPAVMELHGRQSLTKRLVVFQEFVEHERAVALFCTDIAARGVDFPAVDWVVQMDCPDSVDSYIHRVGRTARYLAGGNSALFLLPSEEAFVDKLQKARISIRSIAAKQSKVTSVQSQLTALLSSEGAIRHLAQKAFASYLRSVLLMSDKTVFKGQELPRDEFATSLGLASTPGLGTLGDGLDPQDNPLKRKKNQSALQKLKEKIKAKKQTGAVGDTGDDEAAEEAADFAEPQKAKKLGRWERRQRRIAAAAAAARDGQAGAAGEVEDAEDDLLQPVGEGGSGTGAPAKLEVAAEVEAKAKRRKKMRFGKDGVAMNAEGQHTFFTGEAGEAAKSGSVGKLAQLAEELKGESFGDETRSSTGTDGDEGGVVGRAAFLRRVAKDLASRDGQDAAMSRARVQDLHKKWRRRAKEERRGGDDSDDGAEYGATLGSASSPSASRSPSPEKPPARQGKSKPKRAASPAATPEAPPGSPAARMVAAHSKAIASDELGALEKEALARLGGGGLFA